MNGQGAKVQNSVTNYLGELGHLFLKVRVTDNKNNEIDFRRGIERAIKILSKQAIDGKKIMLIGNGGSASIASHIAVDLWKNGNIRATAFNDSSQLTCLSNDIGYPFVFEKPIEVFADKGDVLIAISSSGRSENILNGADAARKKGCEVLTMSGFKPDNPLRPRGKINFYVPSNSYGYVEITHLALCHLFVDTIIARRDG